MKPTYIKFSNILRTCLEEHRKTLTMSSLDAIVVNSTNKDNYSIDTTGELIKRSGLAAWLPTDSSESLFGIEHYKHPSQHYGYKCECGADKTYGEKDGEYLHSNWCPKYKKP